MFSCLPIYIPLLMKYSHCLQLQLLIELDGAEQRREFLSLVQQTGKTQPFFLILFLLQFVLMTITLLIPSCWHLIWQT